MNQRQSENQMKQYSKYILYVLSLGLLTLLGGVALFSFPIFGWIIFSIIVLIFVFTMLAYKKRLSSIEFEFTQMDDLEKSKDYHNPKTGTLLFQRVEQLKSMAIDGRKVNAQVFSDILSARESARANMPSANIVIVLGLLGTFYGLLNVVSQAGNQLQGKDALSSIDAALNLLFSDMQGIFGTTLCGLVAYILMTLAQSLWEESQMLFMARMEEYTQFHLLPC